MDRTVGKAGCNFNRYSRGDNARQQKQVGYFGITSFEVLNAINPDYFIMSLYGNTLGKNYLDELRNVMKYKFNVEVDSFMQVIWNKMRIHWINWHQQNIYIQDN